MAVHTSRVKIKILFQERSTRAKTNWQCADFHTSGRYHTPTLATFTCKCSLIISMFKLDKGKHGVLGTTNFNPAWVHCSMVSVIILWGSLVYLFLLLCTNSGGILHKVRRGLEKHYREHRHLVWTTVLFNVSRMLVNLTLLKSTVKHYAKYDIIPT